MKPFVLEVWEREDLPEVRTPMYRHPRLGYLDTADDLEDKRLTPAECAAEYWRATKDSGEAQEFGSYGGLYEDWPNDAVYCYEREDILERFATLPHYDEEQ